MTSSTMLNNSGDSGHPCHVLDLMGKGLSFSPFRVVLTLGLSYVAFMILIPRGGGIVSRKNVVA